MAPEENENRSVNFKSITITLLSWAVFMIKRTIVFIIKIDTHDDKTDLKFTGLFSFYFGEESQSPLGGGVIYT